jgi:hypothetical protein
MIQQPSTHAKTQEMMIMPIHAVTPRVLQSFLQMSHGKRNYGLDWVDILAAIVSAREAVRYILGLKRDPQMKIAIGMWLWWS